MLGGRTRCAIGTLLRKLTRKCWVRTSRSLANGATTAYTYGSMSRLVQIAVGGPGGSLWAQRYGFNAAGERIYTLEGSTGTIGDAYQLDATGQHRRLGSREVDSASAEPPAWRRRDERERASQLTGVKYGATGADGCLLYTSPSPRDS